MRKFYLLALTVIVSAFCLSTYAQRNPGSPKKVPQFLTPASFVGNTTQDCDTVSYPIDTAWSLVNYTFSGGGGYISGTNTYGDMQKGGYFDLSDPSFDEYSFISGVRIGFTQANGDLSKSVTVRVYDFTDSLPGTELGSAEVSLATINDNVNNGEFTDVNFPSGFEIPASREFVVSVDFSSLVWDQDSLAVGTNIDGESPPNQSYEQWDDGSWANMSEVYADPNTGISFNVSLYIFPFVSTTATGCSALPVKLLSFNAERKNNDVTLNWKISDEYNMNRYEIERSDNNGTFKAVATLKAVNSLKEQAYSITDKNAFTNAPTVQYRLKQVEGDGSFVYSRVINVKSNSVLTDVTFMNPFNNALKLQLSLASPQPVSVDLYDMQGKLVAREKQKTYNGSGNTIILSSTATLKSGLYVLKVVAGNEQAVYKVVKE